MTVEHQPVPQTKSPRNLREGASRLARSPREKYLVFGEPQLCQDEIDEVVQTLQSGWIGTGPKVRQFEQSFAEFKGVPEANVAAIGSCTSALQLSLKASGVQPGDEVITTAMTFCATVNAIIHTGAKPVIVDIEPGTNNICPGNIESAITPKTRAIVIVHFAGLSCPMDSIMDIVQRYELTLIEDCAHAIETEYEGKPAGTFGHFSAFSFYATKNITTAEGGMVIGKEPKDVNRIKTLALHGMSKDAWRRYSDDGYKHYLVEECGFKCNMTDIQASLGIHQLKRVEHNWIRRHQIWDRYVEALADQPLIFPPKGPAQNRHGCHLFTLQVDDQKIALKRDELLMRLDRMKIGTGVHYLSIPEHPFYQNEFGWRTDEFPVATRFGRRTFSLPLSPALSDEDVEDVIFAVQQSLSPE